MANVKGGFNSLFKQAQRMRTQISKMQDNLAEREVEASSGGDMVKVVVNGNRKVLSIDLNPEIINTEEIDMLQDLITTAFNKAIENVEDMYQAEMSKITGGFNIPGLF